MTGSERLVMRVGRSHGQKRLERERPGKPKKFALTIQSDGVESVRKKQLTLKQVRLVMENQWLEARLGE